MFNTRRKKAMKDAVKETRKLLAGKDISATQASLPTLYQAIDKATKRGVIKKNAAARMKSRITKRAAALAQ